MKFKSLVIYIAIALLPISSFAQSVPSNSPYSQVENALSTYVTDGVSAAVKAWLKGSGLDNLTESLRQEAYLRQFENNHGSLESFEITDKIILSSRSRLIVFVLNFKNGAMFGRIQTYKTSSGDWVTYGFMFNSDLIPLLPGVSRERE